MKNVKNLFSLFFFYLLIILSNNIFSQNFEKDNKNQNKSKNTIYDDQFFKQLGESVNRSVLSNQDTKRYSKPVGYDSNTDNNENNPKSNYNYETYSKPNNIETDPISFNYERFKNSPCHDKIGLNPLFIKTSEDLKAWEDRYKECENDKFIKNGSKFIFFITFLALIGTTIYFSIKKRKSKEVKNESKE